MNITFRGRVDLFNANWWAKAKNEMADVLQQDNEEAWSRERDPQTGAAWAPRKQPTGAWPILRRTGTMQDMVRIKPAGLGIFSTRTTRYGPFHMAGTQRMVARPWLGVPDQSMPKLTAAATRAAAKGKSLRF